MDVSRMQATLDDGGTAIGLWLSLPDPHLAEAAGGLDADYLCVDLQHGLLDYADLRSILPATARSAATPIARVPWNEPGIIGKVLDAGVLGVIVPMVNSVAEAEAAVSACFYQPKGARSHGPIRAATAWAPGYAEEANDRVLCIPMIETVKAVEAIDDILAVPGIDAVYVGPADLSRTLGLPPGPDHDHPDFTGALEAIVAGCDRAGIPAGIHATPALVATRREQGFRMITATSDFLAAQAGLRTALATARGEAGENGPARMY